MASAITAGRYAYDLKLVGPTGKHTRAYEGAAFVSAEVTDDGGTTTPGYGAILLESGGYLLLETGGRLLLEDG